MIAHINVNWLSPVKVRTTLIGGEKKMLVWNDLEADEKIKIYDRGVQMSSREGVYDLLVSYRSGDMWAPKIEQTEALKAESAYFVECINSGKTPFNDGHGRLESCACSKPPRESLNARERRCTRERLPMYRADVKLGKDVKLAQFVNLYGCEIGDETKIGAFVEIQKNAKSAGRCKISSHTFVCEGVTIEDNVFVGHNVAFINDSYPRATTAEGGLQTEKDWKVETTLVKKGASIGSGATILANVTIGENALVGAGSVVTQGCSGRTRSWRVIRPASCGA